MNFEQLHQSELPWIEALQSIRTPALDFCMKALNHFDTFPAYYCIIILLWFGFDRKIGLQVFYLFVLTFLLNSDAKILLAQPRPFALDPSLGILKASSYGFPSGAAQTYTALCLYLGLKIRKQWVWIAGALLVLIVSYSRVYLGLHFPSDIVGGWLLGGLLAFACYALFPLLERYLIRQSKTRLIAITILATILIYLCSLSRGSILAAIAALGATVGVLFTLPLSLPRNLHQRILRTSLALIGVVILIKLSFFTKQMAIGMFLLGLWVGAGVNLLSKKIASKTHK